jgi:hypothetical protein
VNPGFFGPIQRVTDPSNHIPHLVFRESIPRMDESGGYSAAAASEGFTFADDIMKSEMRGTISDLKREPLNTP